MREDPVERAFRLKKLDAEKLRCKRLVSQGVCPRCGDPIVPGSTVCAKHLARGAEDHRKRWRERRAAGRCVLCNDLLPENYPPNKASCPSCLEIRRIKDNARRSND